MYPFRSPSFRWAQALIVALFISSSLIFSAGIAAAEPAWIKGSIRLNLRSGAGTQYKILQSVETGDAMTVLGRAENWTRVRTSEGIAGPSTSTGESFGRMPRVDENTSGTMCVGLAVG